ncbi:MAG: DUF4838 domain-containing protein [Lentisphaerae bacterium]|jgi:hypothetical protein|nr:DUF4838 domain-containing protein [Lentisphaerota bacterium]MBT5606824.1 DUF4838 domain-containing protein [Lentisphaerota bacterium]MBT7055766.1 DUF4838 domain-containing protein [Lentisphaerota bacterium]MBT7843099.1 DUF4838 domain-containing protein [Lentisphaerota bacterium]
MSLRIVLASVFFVLLTPFCVGESAYPGKHRWTVGAVPSIQLAKDGKATCEIVIGRYPYPVAKFAARELQTFLGKVIGEEPPVVAKRSGDVTAIFLGNSEWAIGWCRDLWSLPRDAFVIRSFGDVVFIGGRDDLRTDPMRDLRGHYERATLFGVYEFLERFAGVRFYFPGEVGTVTPAAPNLAIPAVDLYEEPDFDQRRIYSGPGCRWFEDLDPKTATKTRLLTSLRHRQQTFYIPCCHGLARRVYGTRFGEERPEWFALLPNGKRDTDMALPGHRGHLCYLSEGLRDQIYKETEAYLLGKPAVSVNMRTKSGAVTYDHNAFQPGYVDLGPQDGLGKSQWCQMPECKRYWDEKKQGELLWGMVADIGKRLKANGIPGYVTNFAYGAVRDVPDVDFPDNVLVQICISGPWNDRIESQRTYNDELIEAWNKKVKTGTKVWLWNYMNNYNGQVPPGVAPMSTALIQQYYSRLAPHIRGAFNESEIDYWLHNYLNYYVFFRMMWDSSTDVAAVVEEHNRLMFGAGAEPMGQFYARLEGIWTNNFLGKVMDTPLGPQRLKRSEREVWDEIYTDEVMGELGGHFAKAEQLTADEPDSLKRVRFMRERFFGEMLRARGEYRQKQRGVEDLELVVRALPADQQVTLDGRMDEPAWAHAEYGGMVPLKADGVAVHTTVRLLWTPETVYVGFDCQEPAVDRLYATERERDDGDMWKDAGVELFVNTSGDRANYRHIMVNALGNVSDSSCSRVGGVKIKGDYAWNTTAAIKVWHGEDCWQAEVALPVRESQDRELQSGDVWVANFCRNRNISGGSKADNQLHTWSPFLKRGFHDLLSFGRLRFVAGGEEVEPPLVLNGRLEAPLKGRMVGAWYWPQDAVQRAGFALDRERFREGVQSQRIHWDDPESQQSLHLTQYLPRLQPGKRYLLTFWVRSEDVEACEGLTGYKVNHWGGYANICFGSVKQAGNNQFVPKGGFRGTFGWTQMGFPIRAPDAFDPNAKPYIRLSLANATGTVWYDDIRLRETDAEGRLK